MSDIENPGRPNKDLSVPETVKIAALLADLMPPPPPPPAAKPLPAKAAPAAPAPPVQVEEHRPAVPPSWLTEDQPKSEPVPPPAVPQGPSPERRLSPSAERRLTAKVSFTPPAPPVEVRPAAPEPEPVRLAPTPIPPPLPVDAPTTLGEKPARSFLGKINWKNEPEVVKPPAAADAVPAPVAAAPDTDVIPLGNLATTGFFSLVNWRNDPDRVRHPRRSELGLDEQSLAQARSIPFFLAGRPRVPDNNSVAAVLSQVAWE